MPFKISQQLVLEILSKYSYQARFDYGSDLKGMISRDFDLYFHIEKYISKQIREKHSEEHYEKARSKYSEKYQGEYKKIVDKALRYLHKEITAGDLEEHLGNLLYLAEPNYEIDDFAPHISANTVALYNTIYDDLMSLYQLLTLEKNDNNILNEFKIEIKHKAKEHTLDLQIVDPFRNKYLIKSLIEGYKQHMYSNFYGVYWPIPNLSMSEPSDAEKILETANSFLYEARKNSPEANLRDEKLKLILTYLNNETNINPSKKAMPVKAARIIYWLLVLFDIIPETNTKIDSYIISLNNNINRRLKDGSLTYWFQNI